MSNLQPNCCLEFDFRKVDQHAGGKWLIHDTKRRKDNQLQSLKLPCRISKLSSKMWHKGVRSTVLNPIFSKKVQGQKKYITYPHWPSPELSAAHVMGIRQMVLSSARSGSPISVAQ